MKQLLIFFIIILLASFVVGHGEPETITIKISGTGFEPEEVTIEQGDTIVFENVGKNKHWPASDIHPTHGIYPGSNINKCGKEEHLFDSCRGLLPGEKWEFMFEHAGVWKCHDHEYPELLCTITVAENPSFQASSKEGEDELLLFQKAYVVLVSKTYELFPNYLTGLMLNPFFVSESDVWLEYWLKTIDPDLAMRWLLMVSGDGGWIDCHQPAHQIGRVAFKLYGPEIFLKGDASCHSGFYHGAIERLLSEEGTTNIEEIVNETCSVFDTSFGEFECLHGMGHGVLAFERYDLPRALGICERLDSAFKQSSCYGGVFMENIITAQGRGAIPGHETEWVSDDPHFPCNINMTIEMRDICYLMQTSWMLTITDYDYDKVAEECLKADESMRSTCFSSFGRDAAGNSLRDPKKIKELCDSVPELYKPECVTGGLQVIIDFWGEHLEGQAAELCKIIPEPEKKICTELLANRLEGLFTDRSHMFSVCMHVEESYQHLCERFEPE